MSPLTDDAVRPPRHLTDLPEPKPNGLHAGPAANLAAIAHALEPETELARAIAASRTDRADSIEEMPLPPASSPAHPAATAVAGRVLTLSAASADEQRKLARTLRDEATANCAMLDKQMASYCDALRAEKAAIQRDAEQHAKELEAVADKIESSAEGVARYLEDYANTLATVGEHTEDLHNRLRPPVPHPTNGQ